MIIVRFPFAKVLLNFRMPGCAAVLPGAAVAAGAVAGAAVFWANTVIGTSADTTRAAAKLLAIDFLMTCSLALAAVARESGVA